ncbi:MAG TPA: M15 family metallopeptidase [Acidimicrobiales bacterium]|nr:M15 family metallopeptidase [Acidimicrobiales bacterium]
MGTIRGRTALARGMVVVAVATAMLHPGVGAAQEPDAESQRDDVRAQQAEVALEVDVLTADNVQIQAALAELQTNVAAKQTELADAQAVQAAADTAVADATAAVTAGQERVAELDAAADELVVEAFVNPPADSGLDLFRAGTLTEAAVKRSLVELGAEHDASVLAELEIAQAQLVLDKDAKEDAAAEALTAAETAATALADVEAALAQQQTFAAEVEARLEAKLAEAESLKAIDAALSDQIAREQAAVAASLPAGGSGSGSSSILPVPGGLATVSCPAGGSITVAGDIAANLAALLEAAYADGIVLCGGGYRDPEAQIQLRREHCGTSDYAIYEMPASQCDPPTARPGTSMHEQGLAVDFTCNGGGTVSSGSSCFTWLSNNANDYGFYNLPTEPWHWSVNGN